VAAAVPGGGGCGRRKVWHDGEPFRVDSSTEPTNIEDEARHDQGCARATLLAPGWITTTEVGQGTSGGGLGCLWRRVGCVR
jgi:hypothetical protein